MTNSYWKIDFQKIVFVYSPGIQRFLRRGGEGGMNGLKGNKVPFSGGEFYQQWIEKEYIYI
jgi:hypothetical protein